MATAKKVEAMLDEGKAVRNGDWTWPEIEYLNTRQFFTAKPMVYLVNVSKRDYVKKKNKFMEKIAEWVNKNENGGGVILPYSAKFEE